MFLYYYMFSHRPQKLNYQKKKINVERSAFSLALKTGDKTLLRNIDKNCFSEKVINYPKKPRWNRHLFPNIKPVVLLKRTLQLGFFSWQQSKTVILYKTFNQFFSLMFHFYTPWKRQKTFGFLTFSEGIEMWHWTKMG